MSRIRSVSLGLLFVLLTLVQTPTEASTAFDMGVSVPTHDSDAQAAGSAPERGLPIAQVQASVSTSQRGIDYSSRSAALNTAHVGATFTYDSAGPPAQIDKLLTMASEVGQAVDGVTLEFPICNRLAGNDDSRFGQ